MQKRSLNSIPRLKWRHIDRLKSIIIIKSNTPYYKIIYLKSVLQTHPLPINGCVLGIIVVSNIVTSDGNDAMCNTVPAMSLTDIAGS